MKERYLCDITREFDGLLDSNTMQRIYKEVDDKYAMKKDEMRAGSIKLKEIFYLKQVNEYERRLLEAYEAEVRKRAKVVE